MRLVLESFKNMLSNECIRRFTDNQNVERIVLHGSKKPELQSEALGIFSMCVQNKFRIKPSWTPREQNEQADYLSRIVDYDDWMLNPVSFGALEHRWGPHTIDHFTNAGNCQLPRFNSQYWSPSSEAMDAFTCDWAGENNWWCPPIYLVPRVIHHAQKTRAEGTMIVPQWVSTPFWPLLFPDGINPAGFVYKK